MLRRGPAWRLSAAERGACSGAVEGSGANVSGVTAREDDVQSIVALPCGQGTIGTISAPFINRVFE